MKRSHILIALVALAAIAMGVIAYLALSGGSPDTIAASTERSGFTITPSDRTQGSPNAPILMVEYAAPTCPICAGFDTLVFPQIKKKYIDTGKIFYVFRVYPLGSVDIAAEAMARCLPAKNYFPFIDMLFRNQAQWDPDGHQIPDVHGALVKMGAVAGMSAGQVDSCIGNTPEQAQISRIGQEAQNKYGVNGTPSFFVNGQMRVGLAPWEDWQGYLDEMLVKK